MTKPLVRLPPGSKPVPAPLALPAPFGAFVPFGPTSSAGIMAAGGPLPMPSPWTIQGASIQYPGGVVVGAPLGANMGTGAVNVQALYINGQPVDISPFITEALAVQSLNTLTPLTHTPAGAAFFFLIVNEKTYTLADPTPAFSLNGQTVNWTGPPNINPGDEVVASYGTLHAPGATPPGAAYPSPLVPRMDGSASVGADGGFSRGDHVHPIDTSRAPIASPTFTGVPAAPTAALGTATTQLATTQFVANAIGSGGGGTAGVSSWNTRTGAVTLQGSDLTAAGGALTASPIFTGVPAAPTAPAGTSTTQIATTAFVANAISGSVSGVSSFNTRTGAVTLQMSDVINVGGAPTSSPTFTGTPAGPTALAGTSTTQLATCAFVMAAVAQPATVAPLMDGTAAVGTSALYARQDHVHPSNVNNAPLASPAFTGTPTAPTATVNTSTTQLATCAFVLNQASSALPLMDGAGAAGTGTTWSRADHVHPTDTSKAPIASPTFTGTPAAPTATAGTNTTQLATCAFVVAAVAASTAGVSQWNGRTGAVTMTTADVTAAGGAVLASPAFTGTPTAPTATPSTTNTTQIATTAFVQAALAASVAGVSSWNTRTGAVTLTLADVTGVGGAPLASPALTGAPTAPTLTAGDNSTGIATTAFVDTALASYAPLASPVLTGTPSAPTATAGTSTTQLATCAFVMAAIAQPAIVVPLMSGVAAVGTSLLYARQDHVHPINTSLAPLASPVFTGSPLAPTPAPGNNTTAIATTAFVATSFAPIASPAMTGTPTAPTPTAGTNNTQLATTAFVVGGFASISSMPSPATVAPPMDGTAAVGTSLLYARQDHVHPSDTSRAPLVSPTFTGTPSGPTAAPGTQTTQFATTAFCYANFAASSAIPGPATVAPLMNGTAAVGTSTLYARQDHVHPTDTTLAPIASPAFTGTPFAPTAVPGTSTTQLATCAFVMAAIGALAAPPSPASASPLMSGTAAVGTSLLYARQDHVHPVNTTLAPLASPALTGTPTAPTAAGTDNSTTIATTAFVKAALPSVPTTVAKVQLTACFAGIPAASSIVVIPITFAMTIAASLAGSVGNVVTNPTASAAFTVKSGSTTIGTITVNTSGTFSFSGSGGSLTAGNILTVTAPATPDATMANIGISLSATRS